MCLIKRSPVPVDSSESRQTRLMNQGWSALVLDPKYLLPTSTDRWSCCIAGTNQATCWRSQSTRLAVLRQTSHALTQSPKLMPALELLTLSTGGLRSLEGLILCALLCLAEVPCTSVVYALVSSRRPAGDKGLPCGLSRSRGHGSGVAAG